MLFYVFVLFYDEFHVLLFYLICLLLLVCVFKTPWSIHWVTHSKPFSKALCKPVLAVMMFYFSQGLFVFLSMRDLLSLHVVTNNSSEVTSILVGFDINRVYL